VRSLNRNKVIGTEQVARAAGFAVRGLCQVDTTLVPTRRDADRKAGGPRYELLRRRDNEHKRPSLRSGPG
jgi:hypothetical protein